MLKHLSFWHQLQLLIVIFKNVQTKRTQTLIIIVSEGEKSRWWVVGDRGGFFKLQKECQNFQMWRKPTCNYKKL